MNKRIPNFLFPTNFRNSNNVKRLIKDLNVQGYGIAVYLFETLAEAKEHKYSLDDIDLLADEMKVSAPVILTVINSYGIFTIIQDEENNSFISAYLDEWLEPYYKKIEHQKNAVNRRWEKYRENKALLETNKEKKDEKNYTAVLPRHYHGYTNNKRKKETKNQNNKKESKQTSGAKKLNKYTNATQQEFWEFRQEDEIKRDMRTAKLENLNQANKENQILDFD